MSALPEKKKYTPAEYLASEEKAETRNEYWNGEIVAMAGGSLNHIQITSNVSRFIGNRIAESCSSLPTDIKVWIKTLNKFYYPDVTVFCDEPKFYQKRNDTIINPILIVEVLSKSTEAVDRGEKFFAYQTLESFREYVLISQERAVVEHFVKQVDRSWRYLAVIGLESVVKFESVNVEISLKEIYGRVEFSKGNL